MRISTLLSPVLGPVLMVIAACASADSETFPFGHPGDPSHVDRVIKVTATEFKYVPDHITVKKGQTIEFEVTNVGAIKHEFTLGTIAEQAAHDKEMATRPNMSMDDDPNGVTVPKGKTVSLVWTFTRAMSIRYACHIPGHYSAGMFGTLVIRK